jgi:NAD(P)-dependent dehydrogenase (short-subunit alcohol dehydrogenase family)
LDSSSLPRVAVFVGATSGIGRAALAELVRAAVNHGSLRIYVVGRKESAATTQPFLDSLSTLNATADIIWLEADVSLLSEVARICRDISHREKSLDLLYHSAGYVPFGGRIRMSNHLVRVNNGNVI